MRPRRLMGRLAMALFCMQSWWISAQAQTIDLSEISASPNPSLGLAFPGSRTEFYPLIADAGIGIARVSVAWDRVEPSRGMLEWAGLDSRISALQSNGIEPFLTFESNADWATVVETQRVKNARPRDPADWERFVRAVVDRYDADGLNDMPGLGDPVRYWQAANEWISDMNRSGGWVGSTQELIAFIESTHDTIKAQDPRAIFVLGGLASFNLDVLLVARGGHDMTVRQKWSEDSETVLSVQDMRGDEIAQIIDGRVTRYSSVAPTISQTSTSTARRSAMLPGSASSES